MSNLRRADVNVLDPPIGISPKGESATPTRRAVLGGLALAGGLGGLGGDGGSSGPAGSTRGGGGDRRFGRLVEAMDRAKAEARDFFDRPEHPVAAVANREYDHFTGAHSDATTAVRDEVIARCGPLPGLDDFGEAPGVGLVHGGMLFVAVREDVSLPGLVMVPLASIVGLGKGGGR